MYKIIVTTNEGRFFWSSGGLMELRWQGDSFATLAEVESKMKQLQAQYPDWFIQRKLFRNVVS